eukprot:scaffold74050_cov37-Tisochrysis_lutea.AAC.1
MTTQPRWGTHTHPRTGIAHAAALQTTDAQSRTQKHMHQGSQPKAHTSRVVVRWRLMGGEGAVVGEVKGGGEGEAGTGSEA